MKKYLLVFLALFLTAAVVTATVLSSGKKTTGAKEKKECAYKQSRCMRALSTASY